MSELRKRLEQLSTPDHGDGFWARLDTQINRETPGDAPVSTLEPSAADVELDPTLDESVIELATLRRRRLVLVAAAAAVVAGLVFGINGLSDDSSPPAITVDTTSTTTTEPPAPTTTGGESEPIVPDEQATADLRSFGLPIEFSAAVGLTDLQPITVSGSGYSAGDSIAVLQCHGPVDGGGEEYGTIVGTLDICDISGFVNAFPDGNGDYSIEYTPRRFISTEHGAFDCANPVAPQVCAIASGATTDLTKFGIAQVTFDPLVEAPLAPHLSLDRSNPLTDGQTIVVQGHDFVPGETALVAICTLTGTGYDGCLATNGAHVAQADSEGQFTIEVEARRGSPDTDCAAQPFGCRLVGIGTRETHPLLLTFDPTSGPLPARTWPTADATGDGDVVRVELPIIGSLDAGAGAVARQCADGPLAPATETCGPAVPVTVNAGSLVIELTARAMIDDYECFDWRSPRTDLCHIRVETATHHYPNIDLTFDG